MRPYILTIDRRANRHMAGQLVDALAAHSEPTLVCPTPNAKYVRSGARVIEVDFPAHKYQPSFFWKMARLVARLRREKPDVIHCLDVYPVLTLFQPFMRFCPLIQVWHDVTPHPGDRWKFFNTNRRISTRLADAVVVHGEKLKSDFLALMPDIAGKVYAVPHGTTMLFTQWPDEPESVPEEDNVLLFGRIRKYKGVEVFLKAAKLIHEQMPNVTFTIAGQGDVTGYADLLAETRDYVELDNRIVPDELVPKLFRRAKVISLPYIEGSASGVLAVAHGFGKPSVITPVGSIGEYVEDGVTDLVVPPGDHAALAEATMRLLRGDELRARLSAGIRAKVENELSYDRVAIRLLEIYDELIQRRKARR